MDAFAFPAPQATHCHTFNVPPEYLSGNLTLPELWDHHLKQSSDHPLFVYETSTGATEVITWGECVRATHRAGQILLQCLAWEARPVVGILAFPST